MKDPDFISDHGIKPQTIFIVVSCSYSSQCRPLFIVAPQAVSKLPSEDWTKRSKIIRWYFTRLKTGYQTHLKQPIFQRKYICAFRANIAQVIFFRYGPTLHRWFLRAIDQDNIAAYFPLQSCFWLVGEHCAGNFLLQCWHRHIRTTLDRLFSCKNMPVRSEPTLHK